MIGLQLVVLVSDVGKRPFGPDHGFNAALLMVASRVAVRPRLSGTMTLLTVSPVTARRPPSVVRDWEFLAAAAEIEQAARINPTPANRRALAVTRLALGEPAAAVAVLDDLSFEFPADNDVRNDLGAAYLTLFEQHATSYPLPRAMDLLLGIPAGSRSAETIFNTALAADALGLKQQERSAWLDLCRHIRCEGLQPPGLLQKGRARSDSGERMSDIGAATTEFETRLLPILVDRPHCVSVLDASRNLARQLTAEFSERGYAGLVTRLAESCAENRPLRDARLFQRYSAARREYEQRRFSEADSILRSMPAPSEHYLTLLVRYYRGVLAYWRGDRRNAETTVASLLREACIVDSPFVCARVIWMGALLAVTEGRLMQAAASYKSAREMFTASHDTLDAAAVTSSLSEVYDLLGEARLAWQERAVALRRLAEADHPRLHNALLIAEDASRREGLHDSAMAFAREALFVATRRMDGVRRLEAAMAVLRLNGRIGGQVDLASVEGEVRSLATPELRDRMLAELFSARGEGLASVDPSGAVADLDRALDYFTAHGARGRRPLLLFLRAKARIAQARMDLATSDLQSGLKSLSENAAGSESSAETAELLRSDAVLADVVALMNRTLPRVEDALANVDRLRTPYDASASGVCVSCLQQQLGPAEYAVEFHEGAGSLERFIVGRGTVQRRRVELSKDTLRWLTQRALDELRRGESAPGAWDRLSVLLAAGIDRRAERIWIVPPNGAAARLPFAALRWGPGERAVGESAEVVVLQSLASLPHVLNELGQASTEGLTAAVVGPSAAAGLPGATREVSSVAAIYGVRPAFDPSVTILARALQDVRVLHVAGHFEPSPIESGGGAFWFGGRDRVPLPRSVQVGRHRPYLAVLSACATADSGEPRVWVGGAAAGLLRAGVPFVLASLWPVGDMESTAVMVPFHERFAKSRDPVWSFTTTQRAALAALGPRAAFAFQLYAAARRETPPK